MNTPVNTLFAFLFLLCYSKYRNPYTIWLGWHGKRLVHVRILELDREAHNEFSE